MANNVSSSQNDWYPSPPLDPEQFQIRVLRVQPAAHLDQEVSVDLQTVSLNRGDLRYEALSYVWGGYNEQQSIRLHGRPGFRVTDNLYYALRRLRRKRSSRLLWIDAICINQNDVDERNKQVVIMGTIYERAKQTIVWFGESERPGNIEAEKSLRESWGPNWSELIPPSAWIHYNRAKHMVKAISFTAPFYATRGWVVQEIVRSNKIMVCFGPCTVSWSDVWEELFHLTTHNRWRSEALREIFESAREAVRCINQLRSKFRACGPQSEIQVLIHSQHTQCSVPHDKIYSLLALMDPEVAKACQPDYTQSYVSAFVKATSASITQQRNLDILELVRVPCLPAGDSAARPGATVSPSWVVDFRSLPATITDFMGLDTGTATMQWMPNPKSQIELEWTDYTVLKLNGFPLDSVLQSQPLPGADQDLLTTAVQRAIQHDASSAFGFSPLYPTRLLDTPPSRVWDAVAYDKSSLVILVNAMFRYWQSALRFPESADASPAIQRFIDYAESAGDGCVIFCTSRGLLGLGLQGLCEDDEVVYLDGARLPVALKKVGGSDEYTFHGFVFVNGCFNYNLEPQARGDVLQWTLRYPTNWREGQRTYKLR